MERKKLRKPRKGRASGNGIPRRGLHIYQKGDQIKTLTGNRWDVASQGTEGAWCRVSFAGEGPHASAPTTSPERGAAASI